MRRRTMRGVTMVELMVGLVVALLVLLAVLGIYLATVRASTDTMQGTRLNQDLRAAMMVITGDLRRAGYWNQSINAANPFRTKDTLGFRTPNHNPPHGCIRFEYDRNQDGFIAREETFGFRLEGGRLEMLVVDPSETSPLLLDSCGNAVGGEWIPLAGDSGLLITKLEFVDDSQCRNVTKDQSPIACSTVFTDASADDIIVQIRRVNIKLAGSIGPHRMAFEETVRLRNDRRFRHEP